MVQKKVQDVCMTPELMTEIKTQALKFAEKKANEKVEDQLDTYDIRAYVDNQVSSIVKKVVSGHVLSVLLDNMDHIDIKEE